MGFKIQQVLGEVLYPMVNVDLIFLPTPSLYVSTATILVRYYEALKAIVSYLAGTISEGKYYWHQEPHPTLPPRVTHQDKLHTWIQTGQLVSPNALH
jgi:hypothetical protein